MDILLNDGHEVNVITEHLEYLPTVLVNIILSYHTHSWNWKYDYEFNKLTNENYTKNSFVFDNEVLIHISNIYEHYIVDAKTNNRCYIDYNSLLTLINCDSPYIYFRTVSGIVIIDYHKKIRDHMMIDCDVVRHIKNRMLYITESHVTEKSYHTKYNYQRYFVRKIDVCYDPLTDNIFIKNSCPLSIFSYFDCDVKAFEVGENGNYVMHVYPQTIIEFDKYNTMICKFYVYQSAIHFHYVDDTDIVFDDECNMYRYNKLSNKMHKRTIEDGTMHYLNKNVYVIRNKLTHHMRVYRAKN